MAEHMTITDASSAGVSRLASEAEQGRATVLERRHVPVAAVVGYTELERLATLERDLTDLALVLARAATDNGHRTSLDDAIEAAGFTRDQLEAMPSPT